MNMIITERDKKLLGFLAAFLIALMFFLLVFKPLADKNRQIKSELRVTAEQEVDFDNKASGAQDMAAQEEQTKEQLGNVLARFYPMQSSQGAEKMITTLMLNHNMSIQSLTVTMPETASVVKWYQYTEAGREAEITPPKSADETDNVLSLYTARVTCVIEGSDQDLWDLVDDISDHYPAISISSAEWVTTEQPVAEPPRPVPTPEPEEDSEEVGDDEAGDEETGAEDLELAAEEEFVEPEPQMVIPVTQTVKSDRLTISFEIYMCNQ